MGGEGAPADAVEIVHGDRFFREHGLPPATFIKIDVEGFEPQVFVGLKEVFRRDRPVVLAETLIVPPKHGHIIREFLNPQDR